VTIKDDDGLPKGKYWKREGIIRIIEDAFAELRMAVFRQTGLTSKDKQQIYNYLNVRCGMEVEKVKRGDGLWLRY